MTDDDMIPRDLARAMVAAKVEEAAQEVECGCPEREAVLSATNKANRWRACGRDPCGAEVGLDIRALASADERAALDRMLKEAREEGRREGLQEANKIIKPYADLIKRYAGNGIENGMRNAIRARGEGNG